MKSDDGQKWAFLAEMVSLYYSLLLWRNLLKMVFYFLAKNARFSKNYSTIRLKDDGKWAFFGRNGKPIALLFGEICSIFSKNYSTIRLKDDGKWAFLAKMVSL